MKIPTIVLCVVVCTCLVQAQVTTPESLTDAQLAEVIGRVQLMPASRSSMRARTDSLPIMTLTLKYFPISRKNSR